MHLKTNWFTDTGRTREQVPSLLFQRELLPTLKWLKKMETQDISHAEGISTYIICPLNS